MIARLGLKLWSTNIDYYFDEAKRLYQDKVFNYIELYVVPNTLQNIEKWKGLEIPFALHAPHFKHKINLAETSKFAYNREIFQEVEEYRRELNARYTIVHSGMHGDIKETVRQLNAINPVNAFIENKPFKAPLDTSLLCRGATVEEISFVLNETHCGFCLDIGHAMCSANSLAIEPYHYLKEFQKLSPSAYHLSGNHSNSDLDNHLHLHEGNYNYKKIFSIINLKNDIAIETNKDSLYNLVDFVEDVAYIKNYS